MTLRDSEYLASLVLDCIRLQARGDKDGAERVYWQLAGILGESEAKRRLAVAKGHPDERGKR